MFKTERGNSSTLNKQYFYSKCVSPIGHKGGGESNTRLRGVRGWGTQFGRLYRKPGTLFNLCKPLLLCQLAGNGGGGGNHCQQKGLLNILVSCLPVLRIRIRDPGSGAF